MASYLNQDGLDKLVELTKQDISGVEEKAESAQEAAEKAQETADQAVTDAASAQETADSAASAAATAQSTAEKAQSTVDSATSAASAAQSTADQALETANDLYSDSIRPNVIRNTNDINELGSTGTWDAGTWRQVNQSGSTRTSTRIDVDDAPDPHISCGVRCYTESGTTYAKIRQDGVPMEEGAYYTASFYARGSGQAQFQYGMSPYVATNFDVTDDWERYYVGFTFVGADCASTDGSTYIYFGTGSAATVEICGMMLEKWDEMTDWMPNPLDAKDTTARETADSAATAAANAQSTADTANTAAANAQSTAEAAQSTADQALETAENVSQIYYGTCSTSGSTAAKVVTCDGFTLETGATICVCFTNANSASSPTMNVDSTGAKSITSYGTTAMGTGWSAGAVIIFTYDGTSWVMNNLGTSAFLASCGEIIPDNSDLNDYIYGGKYYIGNASGANTLENIPANGAGFSLYVTRQADGSGNRVYQFFTRTVAGGFEMWGRSYRSEEWSEWNFFPTATEKTVGSSTNPVYLNSGTITACSVSDMIYTSQATSSTISISANSSYTNTALSFNVPSGYSVLGISGYNISGDYGTLIIPTRIRWSQSGSCVQLTLRNTGSGTASVTIALDFIYLKTS